MGKSERYLNVHYQDGGVDSFEIQDTFDLHAAKEGLSAGGWLFIPNSHGGVLLNCATARALAAEYVPPRAAQSREEQVAA